MNRVSTYYPAIMMLVLLASCSPRKGKGIPDRIETSYYQLQNIVQPDSVEVSTNSAFSEEAKELDSFLVDLDLVRKKDSLLTKECDWYCLKSLIEYNTAVDCSIYVDLPSTASWRMNTTIKKQLLTRKEDFLEHLREIDVLNNPFRREGIESDFRAQLTSAFEDSNYVSFCFMISSYSAGSAHGMHEYETFNFEKASGKRISFNDLFEVKTSEDSVLMCDLITESIGIGKLDHISVYEYDFNLNEDYVVFNFDAYEVGPYGFGAPRAPLNRRAMLARFGKGNKEF